jgi:hypothetical protein
MKLLSTRALIFCFITIVYLGSNQQLRAAIQYTNEIWISTNATGNMYGIGGSIDNPLDGSTRTKFDSNMGSIPPYTTIHIMPGTYTTYGSYSWGPKTGQKLVGSGRANTIIQFDPAAVSAGTVNGYRVIGVYQPWANLQTNIEITDLTADANYQSGATGSFDGVGLNGSYNTVRRVNVINLASYTSSYNECWGITLESWPWPSAKGNVIEDCQVSGFTCNGVNNLSAICIMENNYDGVLRNNRVIGNPLYPVFALGVGQYNCLVEGNYVENAYLGSHTDDGSGITNAVIIANHFVNCATVLDWANGAVKNLLFGFNNIVLTNSPGAPYNNGQAGVFYFQPSPSSFTNITIIGNQVTFDGSVNVPYLLFIHGYNIGGMLVANNTVDSRLTNLLVNCSNLNIDNNFDQFGNYRSDMNSPTLGGIPVTSYGISLASSVGQSSALTTLGLPNNPTVIVTNNSTQPVTVNANLTVNGNASVSSGNAYFYNGQYLAYGITGLNDYFFGGAGNFTMTGNENTAVGYAALASDTTGFWNTAVGVAALQNTTTSYDDTAIGGGALEVLTTGLQNTAVGAGALGHEITGGANNAVGFLALSLNTNGSFNVANGAFALQNNTGSYNTADGGWALYSNTIGSFNIALGIQAGYNLATGSSNIDIGNFGVSTDNNITRIGTSQSDTYVAGIIHGNGAGLTSLNASQLTTGTVPQALLPVAVVTNNATGVTLGGTFNGNGSGLTNLTVTTFTSSLFVISNSAATIIVSHNLGVTPTFVRWVMVCQTNDVGYNVGDEVQIDNQNFSTTPVFTEGANSNNVFLCMNSINVGVNNKTNAASRASITDARWRFKCYARP